MDYYDDCIYNWNSSICHNVFWLDRLLVNDKKIDMYKAQIYNHLQQWYTFATGDELTVRKAADAHAHKLCLEAGEGGKDSDIRVIDEQGNVYWHWLWADFSVIGHVDDANPFFVCERYHRRLTQSG